MENKKQSLPLALTLSFLVALVGACLWGVLYYFGWFASIISFITAFGMFFVYLKFYNKMNYLPFVWTLVWIILLNIFASFFAIVIAVSKEAGVTLGVAFTATIENFSLVVKDFAVDMLLGTVFSVLGVISYYRVYKVKQAKTVEQNVVYNYTTLDENALNEKEPEKSAEVSTDENKKDVE